MTTPANAGAIKVANINADITIRFIMQTILSRIWYRNLEKRAEDEKSANTSSLMATSD